MYSQINNDDNETGIFHNIHGNNQISLIAYCTKKAKETHRVKSEEVKHQTAKRLAKKTDQKEQQLLKLLKAFKSAAWLHQQHRSPRFWKSPKKAMDEFAKITAECTKKTFVKEQMLIIYLGLGFEEAWHLWSKDGREYTAVELLEHFIKVCIPLTRTQKLLKETPMEHPRILNLPTLDTMTSDVTKYYTEQARDDNELRLKALKGRGNEVLMGVWDGCEYMNEVN